MLNQVQHDDSITSLSSRQKPGPITSTKTTIHDVPHLDNGRVFRHGFDMKAPAKSQQTFTIRDDNLRLLFSETELRILDEKRADAIAGFYAIGIVILATGLIALFFFATPFASAWNGTDLEVIIVGLGLIGFLGVLLTIVSPIILIGLMIELRKAAKERASLIDLLVRYKRPIPDPK